MTSRSERFQLPNDDALSSDQRDAIGEISSGPRGAVIGPFGPLLASPRLMTRVQKVGEFLRFESDLPDDVLELAILIVARHWDQGFEWGFHRPLALAAGISPTVVDDIEAARVPDDWSVDHMDVWELAQAVLHGREVEDELFDRLVDRRGDAAVVELITTIGYYTTLAFVLNSSGIPALDNGVPALPQIDQP